MSKCLLWKSLIPGGGLCVCSRASWVTWTWIASPLSSGRPWAPSWAGERALWPLRCSQTCSTDSRWVTPHDRNRRSSRRRDRSHITNGALVSLPGSVCEFVGIGTAAYHIWGQSSSTGKDSLSPSAAGTVNVTDTLAGRWQMRAFK